MPNSLISATVKQPKQIGIFNWSSNKSNVFHWLKFLPDADKAGLTVVI